MLKLLNETDDTKGTDPLSADLAMLGAAIHRIPKFRQSHYDEFLDNGYESLKDKEPSVIHTGCSILYQIKKGH